MDNIKCIQFIPFLSFTTNIISSHPSFSQSDKIFRVLEVGCGTGEFAILLKDHFKNKLNITAIDPLENTINQAKTLSADVSFQQKNFQDWQQENKEAKLDIIIFTKSLHHCDNLEKSIKQAYGLLLKNGILIAEELQPEKLDANSIYWFFDRIDLLKTTGRLHSEQLKERYQNLLNEKIDAVKRWETFIQHRSCHQPQDVIEKVVSIFDQHQNQVLENMPFLHYWPVLFGLEDTEIGRSILKEFMVQEDRSITNGTIKSIGVYIIAKK
ncbi:unnamed protein product [Cunninghamella echinulata]